MAQTKSSVYPTQHKKSVYVGGYKKSDGTKVGQHYRSVPSKGK